MSVVQRQKMEINPFSFTFVANICCAFALRQGLFRGPVDTTLNKQVPFFMDLMFWNMVGSIGAGIFV